MRSIKSMTRLLLLGMIAISTLIPQQVQAQVGSWGTVPVLRRYPLTSRQRERINMIQRQTQRQIYRIRMNDNLSQREKSRLIMQAERRGQQQIMNVLTPRQREELRMRRYGRGMRRPQRYY